MNKLNILFYKSYPFSGKLHVLFLHTRETRGESRAAATFKMKHFVIIVNGYKPLTIITKSSILDVAAVLDPPLMTCTNNETL